MYQRVVFVLVSGRVATLVGVVLSAHGSTCTGNRRWIPGHCLLSNAGRGFEGKPPACSGRLVQNSNIDGRCLRCKNSRKTCSMKDNTRRGGTL